MATPDDHLKLVKRLANSLIGIIVSLAAFACGFAAIVLYFSDEGLETDLFMLICFLASLPLIGLLLTLIGFIVFLLVVKANTIVSNLKKAVKEIQKLSGATDPTTKVAVEEIKKLLEEINEQLSKTSSK